jgi:hypothetical protein
MQNPRTTRAAYKKFNSKGKRNAKKGPLGHDEGQAVHLEEKDFLIGMLCKSWFVSALAGRS